MKTEPMALATGLGSVTVGPIAPEASVYGTEKTFFESPFFEIAIYEKETPKEAFE